MGEHTLPNAGWRVGDVVEDLYEVRAILTAGNMGMMCRVWHRGWALELAVKSPKREWVNSSAAVANFETEAQTWVDLGVHPNIVSCVYVRRIGGLSRVFAEWVDGGSLADAIVTQRLYQGGPETAAERILDIAIQLAWGIGHAHEHGLIHQDVKPGNVMLTAIGDVKLTDFGLARARVAAGQTLPTPPHDASIVANYSGMTPGYCSPEQAQSAARPASGRRSTVVLTTATDIWSWAVSVLEMFLGERTWGWGPVAAETLDAYLADGVRTDDPTIPAMPVSVAQLLGECLTIDPAARPRGIGEIADRLSRIYRQVTGRTYPRRQPLPVNLVADGLNNQALSMLDLGHADRAGQFFQQALAVDPHHLHALYNDGLYRWRIAETTDDRVLTDLDTAHRFHRDDHTYFVLAARVHLERGDSAAANWLLAEARAFSPADPDIAATQLDANRRPGIHIRTLTGHTDSISSVALSADGLRALTGSGDAAQIWDTTTGALLHLLTGGAGALSADGRLAITSGSQDGSARIWDTSIGACQHVLDNHLEPVGGVAVTTDGRLAITNSEDRTQIWDTSTGICRHVLEGHTRDVFSVAFSADGRLALTGSQDTTARIWDTSIGICRHVLRGHTRDVFSVAFSTDGRFALTGSFDKTARIWDTSTGICRHVLTGHSEFVFSVAFSADGRFAMTGSSDKTARIWDTSTGICRHVLRGHTNAVLSVAFSPDGRLAMTGSPDKTARIWDTANAICRYSLVTTGSDSTADVAWSRNGKIAMANSQLISFGTDNQPWEVSPLPIWSHTRPRTTTELVDAATAVESDAAAAQRLLDAGLPVAAAERVQSARAVPGYARHPRLLALLQQAGRGGRRSDLISVGLRTALPSSNCPTLSLDGRFALTGSSRGDDTARIWDTGTGDCRHVLMGHARDVTAAAFSPDGRLALTGSYDQTARIWDTSSGICRHSLTGHTESVYAVAFSPDGHLAVTGSTDNTARIWNTGTGACQHVLTGHTWEVESVAFSPDGRYVVTRSNRTARIWDTATGTCRRTFTRPEDPVSSCSYAFTRDSWLVLTGSSDQIARIWDTSIGVCQHRLIGHTGWVDAVAFSPDGKLALTGSFDRTARIWDTSTGVCRHVLTHTDSVHSVAFSPDGHLAVTGSHDSTARIWDTSTGACQHTFDALTADPVGSRFLEISDDGLTALIRHSVWQLDWDYEFPDSQHWDDGARSI